MEKFKDIYIIRYLNGERNFFNERTAFNFYETEQLLGEEKTFQIAALFKDKISDYPLDSQADITRITLDLNNLNKELDKLSKEIYEHSKTVSGDDDVFDYFPDLIYAFYQICEQLNRLDYYNKVISYLNENNIIADDPYEPMEIQHNPFE